MAQQSQSPGSRPLTLVLLIIGALLLALGATFLVVASQNPHAATHPLFVYGT
jgi:hypothetical protein